MSEKENLEPMEMEAAATQEAVPAPKAPAKDAKADKPKKAKSDDKKAKPGVFARISRWFREMKSELKKVQWPSMKQTLNNTAVVIICVIIVGFFIWVFDWLASGVIDALLRLFQG